MCYLFFLAENIENILEANNINMKNGEEQSVTTWLINNANQKL